MVGVVAVARVQSPAQEFPFAVCVAKTKTNEQQQQKKPQLKAKTVTRNKEGHYIIIKASIVTKS